MSKVDLWACARTSPVAAGATLFLAEAAGAQPGTEVTDPQVLEAETVAGVLAPATNARPGDFVRVRLDNRLPPTTTPVDPGCSLDRHGDVAKPHCFNRTNLHGHGLWVNPSGNCDDVRLSIEPGVKFEYEYAIPSDHPAGTFWYRTHRHGSTALQVSSAMAGALVIRGDRLPTATRPGDIDTLPAGTRDRRPARSRTTMFIDPGSSPG